MHRSGRWIPELVVGIILLSVRFPTNLFLALGIWGAWEWILYFRTRNPNHLILMAFNTLAGLLFYWLYVRGVSLPYILGLLATFILLSARINRRFPTVK